MKTKAKPKQNQGKARASAALPITPPSQSITQLFCMDFTTRVAQALFFNAHHTKIVTATLLIFFLTIGNPVNAAEISEMQTTVKEWTGEAEVGMISTTGKTRTDTINANGKVTTERARWRQLAQVTARNTADDSGTTAERYELKLKSSFKVINLNYFYAQINYVNDRFSDYEYILTESLGYGRRILDNDDMRLDLEIGPGLRQKNGMTGNFEADPIISAGALFAWKFSSTSKFGEDFTLESSDDATISKSVSSLTTQVGGSLAMKISYTAKNASSVRRDATKFETESAITLVHSFGL